MNAAWFLETRGPAWKQLEMLLKTAGRKGAAGLTDEQLHQLTRLYPAVAVDVARARMLNIDARTQTRINRLAIAAHGMLYRRRRVRAGRAMLRFFRYDYPQLFRRLGAHVLLATAIFLIGAVVAYVSVRVDPDTARLFVPGGLDIVDSESVTAEDISERYRMMPGSIMAGAITTNNIQVAFYAFALGIALGLGTGWVVLTNALMLGGFVAHFVNHGLGYEVCSFLTPHGALEIFAILVAAGAGLRMGLSLAVPGGQTWMASLKVGAREAVLLVLGTIPMFILAGAIESYVTPSYIPNGAKILVGLAALGTTLAYLLTVGHPIAAPKSQKRPAATAAAST